jgi:hypothetical protein
MFSTRRLWKQKKKENVKRFSTKIKKQKNELEFPTAKKEEVVLR